MPPHQPAPDRGLILSFIKPTRPHRNNLVLLPQTFTSHILGTESSTRYQAANPNTVKQHLLVSTIDDISRVNVSQVAKFWAKEQEVVGEGDVRLFKEVEVYGKGSDETASTILIALMQPPPGGEEELDRWYREEHNQQMSEQRGWLRTCRFELVARHGGGDEEEEEEEKEKGLSFLAIHKFSDDNDLGLEVKAVEPVSEWTKKLMGEAVGIDAAIYRKKV
ncbi:aldehyde dehydrogenase [Stemphylium lycopersici]|uniref:Aldehyde dehydrogenase n=1 Tax=Stemphylium lycopersici TaxID=183478 RepID=A0A364MW12_STELY|nr:aldehyde dehydrogenase [Stemphylium lycopersici]RAQ99367.1 aldehyde dehydrogenase [Stemphylium lycopersici]RAR05203.1 aldehyde dehydrogenase [Stemphylium lycopersici]